MEENALENALKQIQSWFVNGEFEKVKQGCEEILQISPNNSIAQDLLQKANEALNPVVPAEVIPEPPVMPETPTSEPAMEPSIPSLTESPEEPIAPPVEETIIPEPEPPMPEPVNEIPNNEAIPMPAAKEIPEEEHHRTHSLIINILILVVLIAVGILAVYAYQAIKKDDPDSNAVTPIVEEQTANTEELTDDGKGTTEEITDEESLTEEIVNPNAEERNNERLTGLTSIENALIYYYDAHKKYPTVDEINTVLIDEGFIEALPLAPLENEAYIYAVYDTDLGPAQNYVLSAYFENEDGSTSPWSTGANTTTEYPNFNDVTQENITILHETMTEEEYLTNREISETEILTEETVTAEPTDERVRVPRVVLD